MKKLLLTGFEPFLEFPINPSADIVNELDGTECGVYKIFGKLLPVDFELSAPTLLEYFDQVNPDVVISLGLAAGRDRITPERIAINCNDGAKDNKGFAPEDQRIVDDGAVGYFSTLPIRRFVQVLKENGFPAEISNTAGTYLCNNVMYHALHKISLEKRECIAGFVHLPASHQLALTKPNLPSWSQRDLLESVKLIISSL